MNNKPANSEGQQGNAERKHPSAPAVPPTYEEATSAEGMKAGAFPPPLNVPLHPTWAYADPSELPGLFKKITTHLVLKFGDFLFHISLLDLWII